MNKKTEIADIIVQNPLVNSSVEKMIQVIREKQVLLDRDLATLYGVETKALNQAVKRNQERFPERNCFMLKKEEIPESLKSQVVTLNECFQRIKKIEIANCDIHVFLVNFYISPKLTPKDFGITISL